MLSLLSLSLSLTALRTAPAPAALRTVPARAAVVTRAHRVGTIRMAYARAEGDDAEVDEQLVLDLIGEREELREARDFDAADAVREELTAMNVVVRDREQLWFVASTAASGYRRRAGDDAEIDEDQVEALLLERKEARRVRDFRTADAAREKLADMGVTLFDVEAQWFVNPPLRQRPPPGAARGPFVIQRDFGPLGHDYTRATVDETALDEAQLSRVNDLIKERLECKMTRRFSEADAVLATLQTELNVEVHDGLKSWRADGHRWMPPGYKRIPGEGDDREIDVAQVEALVGERADARRQRDYESADGARLKLQRLGIYVDDKGRTWTTMRPRY